MANSGMDAFVWVAGSGCCLRCLLWALLFFRHFLIKGMNHILWSAMATTTRIVPKAIPKIVPE